MSHKIYYRHRAYCWPLPYWRKSLRLIFPFIPNQVSMFLIGSITSATFVFATMALWLEKWPRYCLDCYQ